MGDIWTCKIGRAGQKPSGADAPMRDAIVAAYRQITGEDPDFIFSGWGGELTEGEQACVEGRLPDPDVVIAGYRKTLDDALDGMNAAVRYRDAERDPQTVPSDEEDS